MERTAKNRTGNKNQQDKQSHFAPTLLLCRNGPRAWPWNMEEEDKKTKRNEKQETESKIPTLRRQSEPIRTINEKDKKV